MRGTFFLAAVFPVLLPPVLSNFSSMKQMDDARKALSPQLPTPYLLLLHFCSTILFKISKLSHLHPLLFRILKRSINRIYSIKFHFVQVGHTLSVKVYWFRFDGASGGRSSGFRFQEIFEDCFVLAFFTPIL